MELVPADLEFAATVSCITVNQSSLPHSILGSRNSHTHAGTASNCSSFTKQGTGFHDNNITESTVVLEYAHQGDF